MKSASSRFDVHSTPGCFGPVVTLLAALLAVFASGCGGGGSETGATFSGNTTVTLFLTGTANDVLTSFPAGFDSLTLTNKTGATVQLLSSQISADFIHQNGTAHPEFTLSIPQGVYVSATASYTGGGYLCENIASNGDYNHQIFGYNIPEPNLPVTLPAPITIAGSSMGLLLNLAVSQSLSPDSCPTSDGEMQTQTIQPDLVLTPMTLAAQPTNSANGLALNQQGMIASIDSGAEEFSVNNIYDSFAGQVTVSRNTAYQGVAGFSDIAAGMPVEIDEAVQADGSLVATRIQVYDKDTNTLSVNIGPLLSTNYTLENATIEVPNLLHVARIAVRGTVPVEDICQVPDWKDSNAVFQVSGELSNLSSLPFPARFDAASVAPGQLVAATTHDSLNVCLAENRYSSAATITLLPQTIDGTVEAVSGEGGFATYTIRLAPYDLFPVMGSQPNQVLPVANPDIVVVYADSNTQMLNTSPIAIGNVARFYGLVFNDNGTLRMDCAQINDGVAE